MNAFIVRKGTPGMKTVKIENKTALRCVQNADIYLDSAEVDESDRLPGVESFKDTNKVRAHQSSVMIHHAKFQIFLSFLSGHPKSPTPPSPRLQITLRRCTVWLGGRERQGGEVDRLCVLRP